jgi:archaemetzincin
MNKTTYMGMAICFLVTLSCTNKEDNNTAEVRKEKKEMQAKKENLKAEPPCITIYCYGDVPSAKPGMLGKELQKYYPRVELAKERLALPKEQYLKERNRYSGTGLLKDLSRQRKGTVALGVTDEVIFQANEKSPTFGVFGISYVGYPTALVSLKQPSGKRHPDRDLVKLTLHELGHAFGLEHCPVEHCIMADAKHKNNLPNTKTFCKDCKDFLNKKNWNL